MLKQPVQQRKEAAAFTASSYYNTQGCPPCESCDTLESKTDFFLFSEVLFPPLAGIKLVL